MNSKWQVHIFIWPHFPAKENQKLVGDHTQKFEVIAPDFSNAVTQAKNILTGIKTNPAVWQAGILGVISKGEVVEG